jgi:TolA-binding protein
MPQAASETDETTPVEESFEGGDFGDFGYESYGPEEGDDVPSLALTPESPPDAWSWDLIEPSLESGEVFLPDLPPEEGPLVLAEPLPEPEPPELGEDPVLSPELAEEEMEEEALQEDLAEEPSPEESPDLAEETPEPPPPPSPPPRIVRPSEPLPPPPPIREILPMPPNAIPDLPARNPPTLTPPSTAGVSSRIVRVLTGQTLEVPFRGSGWVYLGEASSKRGMDYASRRLDGEGQTFVFRAVESGTYELKFFRQDYIRDYIINDMVTVIVEEPPPSPPQRFGATVDRGIVVAEPRWPTLPGAAVSEAPPGPILAPVEGAGASSSTAPGEAPAKAAVEAQSPTAPVTALSAAGPEAPAVESSPSGDASPGGVARDFAPEEYLRRAREEYQGGRHSEARAILDQFLEGFPLGSDEAYWLYAQVCERQGPTRNIRLALDYYRRLVVEYPQSGHYNEARRRIAYLERYYINIQ